MSALELLEGCGSRFVAVVATRGLDGLLALPLVAGAWWLLRRRATPHLRAWLPWLALVPLVVPLGTALPERWTPLGWRSWIAPASADGAAPRVGAGDASGRAAPTAGGAQPFAGLLELALHGDRSRSAPTTGEPRRATDEAATARSAADGAPGDERSPAATLLFVAWLAVVASGGVQWWRRSRRWRAALAGAQPLPLAELGPAARTVARQAAARGIALAECATLPAPLAVGLLRRRVLLPTALRRELDDEGLRFVLLHELAHHRRGDLWLGLLLRVVRLLWFFHPAPWLAGRWIASARELACDDVALAKFPPPARAGCAETFLKVVDFSRRADAESAGLAAMADEVTEVRSRLMRMVDGRIGVADRLSRGGAVALAAAAAVALLGMQPPAQSANGGASSGAVSGLSGGAAASAPPLVAASEPPVQEAAAQEAAPLDPQAAQVRAAVLAAGRWLALHQHADGYWDADRFADRCRECSDPGAALNDIGVTSLAALALIEAERFGDPQAKHALATASNYLLSVQDRDDGNIGAKSGQHFMYGHMLATLALGRLEARAPETKRAAALQWAIDFIVRSRNPYKAWRYAYPPDGDNDTSVTVFALLAMEQAMELGIAVDASAVHDGESYVAEMRDPTTGRVGYHEKGSLSARNPDDMDRFPADLVEAITAAALHVSVAQGDRYERDQRMVQGLALLLAKPPRWDEKAGTIDYYYWWHGTEAVKAAGDARWVAWRAAVSSALLPHGRNDGHRTGSFDAAPDPWGDNGGRVYSTAINALTLAATVE